MSITAIALPQASAGAARQIHDSPEKVRDAAGQFESMMIAQLLRTARESSSASGDGGENLNSTYMDLAEQQFAQALTARGGLGIAKMVVAQLRRS